ncbi:MAG: iron ABC transporter permease [Neptuniibacter sp.]
MKNSVFYLAVIVILSPIIALGVNSIIGKSEVFAFLVENVLADVFLNSLIIMMFTSIGVLTIGVATAWFVVHYQFRGRKIIQWALCMPLAFPAYILAYIYTDFFDGAAQYALMLNSLKLGFLLPDFRTVFGASFILTFCLYPYVYLFARNGFLASSQSQMESARLLGAGKWEQFFTIALPAARPFIIVGLMLVTMEVLADYGTMDYFGIRVFSTVIYDSWAGYGDITAATHLSLLLLVFVMSLVFLEKNQRGKMKFYENGHARGHINNRKKGTILVSFFCVLPILIGFIFPMTLLLIMVVETFDILQVNQTIPYLYNTLISSTLVASLGVLCAYILALSKREQLDKKKDILFNLCGSGYALPGIILGLGLLLMSSLFSYVGVLVTGTFIFLILGYLIRFLNVALQGVEAGYDKISPSIDEASALMRRRAFDDFWYIKLPLLWPSMLSAGLILAVEVIKELPITLVLRPFDFDTLAVHTYNLASDERLADASFPALCIVIVSCIPIILLQNFSDRHMNNRG